MCPGVCGLKAVLSAALAWTGTGDPFGRPAVSSLARAGSGAALIFLAPGASLRGLAVGCAAGGTDGEARVSRESLLAGIIWM
jgi:hypothetical protein